MAPRAMPRVTELGSNRGEALQVPLCPVSSPQLGLRPLPCKMGTGEPPSGLCEDTGGACDLEAGHGTLGHGQQTSGHPCLAPCSSCHCPEHRRPSLLPSPTPPAPPAPRPARPPVGFLGARTHVCTASHASLLASSLCLEGFPIKGTSRLQPPHPKTPCRTQTNTDEGRERRSGMPPSTQPPSPASLTATLRYPLAAQGLTALPKCRVLQPHGPARHPSATHTSGVSLGCCPLQARLVETLGLVQPREGGQPRAAS